MTVREAMQELKMVFRAWRAREGDLLGLIWAWLEVITGRVVIEDDRQPSTAIYQQL